MAYKPSFKWTDELVLEFAKLSTLGSYGIFEGAVSIEDKLIKFKAQQEAKKREDRVKRVLVGKRGMNDDGSRFYYDNRGVRWTIRRTIIHHSVPFYVADSERNEAIREKFLSDLYIEIDKLVDRLIVNGTATSNFNLQEILK